MANNPAVIREKFERILKDGNDIPHIAFPPVLSGSYNNVLCNRPGAVVKNILTAKLRF